MTNRRAAGSPFANCAAVRSMPASHAEREIVLLAALSLLCLFMVVKKIFLTSETSPAAALSLRGRPRKDKAAAGLVSDVRKIFLTTMNRQRRLKAANKTISLSAWEAGMERTAAQFANGDPAARRFVMELTKIVAPEQLAGANGLLQEALAQDHQAIIDAFLRRNRSEE